MKNLKYLWAVAASCLMACSADDSVQPPANEAGEEQAVNSDVPILFAPVQMAAFELDEDVLTRSAVDETNFEVDNVGLFCLAKRCIDGSGTTPSWRKPTTSSNLNMLDNNSRVRIKNLDGRTGIITWDGDTLNLRYYPQQEKFAYGFVAYHPRTEYINYTSSSVMAYIPIDGDDDVFYSMSAEPTMSTQIPTIDNLAFSKAYYEAVAPSDPSLRPELYPYFKFERLTSRLDFYLRLKDTPSKRFKVEKLWFDDFPCIMHLRLARRSGSQMLSDIGLANRSLYIQNESVRDSIYLALKVLPEALKNANVYGTFTLKGQNGGALSADNIILTTERQKIGDCIMIPPVAANHSKSALKLNIIISDEDGQMYKNSMSLKISAPATGWLKGKKYDINLSINSPYIAGTRGELDEWEAGTDINVTTDVTWASSGN